MNANPRRTSKAPSETTIGIFSAYYPPHLGGVERFSSCIAHTLARLGYRVVVVTSAYGNAPDVEAEDGIVELHRVPSIHIKDRIPLLEYGPRFDRHWKLIEEIAFDAVIVNTRFYPLSIAAARLASKQGIRPIVIEHGSAHLQIGNKAFDQVLAYYEHALTNQLLRYDPVFYGVSKEACAWTEHFGAHSSGIIHNAIDANEFRKLASARDFRYELGLPPETKLIVFAGRLLEEKGVMTVAQAACELTDNHRVHFVLAGDGPARHAVESLALPNLNLVGSLDRADVAALFGQGDIFCFPSRYPEGLPTVLLEAGVCNCYLISAATGGVREIIPDSSYGRVLDDKGPHALAQAIRGALQHEGAMRLAASRCRTHIEDVFTWEASANAIVRAFEENA